ncbi:MAG TPA: hypothetical protein VFD92_19920 [Candidatus Binatia bacterium]|nr:hypothetical protein [Candidatus Binatia bacterium]
MTMSWADGWIDSGCRSAATVLRSVAAVLVDLADWLEGNEGPARHSAWRAGGDNVRPLTGTRERIGAALGRARQRYEAVAPAIPTNGRARRTRHPR